MVDMQRKRGSEGTAPDLLPDWGYAGHGNFKADSVSLKAADKHNGELREQNTRADVVLEA